LDIASAVLAKPTESAPELGLIENSVVTIDETMRMKKARKNIL